jgi:hypothetical protein
VPQHDEEGRPQMQRRVLQRAEDFTGPMAFPATRMMKRSPAASKTSSGGTRESLQPRIVAYGCCRLARLAKTSLRTVGKRALPRTKRLLPAMRRASAMSAR